MNYQYRKARKDHCCTLCWQTIPIGSPYVFSTITPWDHPDNDCFADYKAHEDCNEMWQEFGDVYDWVFPLDSGEWKEMIAP